MQSLLNKYNAGQKKKYPKIQIHRAIINSSASGWEEVSSVSYRSLFWVMSPILLNVFTVCMENKVENVQLKKAEDKK